MSTNLVKNKDDMSLNSDLKSEKFINLFKESVKKEACQEYKNACLLGLIFFDFYLILIKRIQ